jgi:hypothetical protein
VPQNTAANNTVGVVKFEENILPVVVFGFRWNFFCMTTATVVGRMCCFSFSQLAVADVGVEEAFSLLRQSLCKWLSPYHAAGRLLAIHPDMAKLLAILALLKGIL